METNQMETLLEEAAQAQPQPQEDDPQLRLRAQELITQARTLWQVCQVDVLAIYNTDVEVRAKVLSGQWDFVDVYKAMKPAPTPPAPVRSVGGNTQPQGGVDVSGMSNNQFERLNQLLKKGGKVSMM